jgi:hypothetical protein
MRKNNSPYALDYKGIKLNFTEVKQKQGILEVLR